MDSTRLPKAKPTPSFDSDRLTPSEIESLRQDKRDTMRRLDEMAAAAAKEKNRGQAHREQTNK